MDPLAVQILTTYSIVFAIIIALILFGKWYANAVKPPTPPKQATEPVAPPPPIHNDWIFLGNTVKGRKMYINDIEYYEYIAHCELIYKDNDQSYEIHKVIYHLTDKTFFAGTTKYYDRSGTVVNEVRENEIQTVDKGTSAEFAYQYVLSNAPKHALPETFVPMTTNDSDRMYEAQKAKMMEGVDVPPEIARREANRAHWNEVYKSGKK